MNTLLTRNFYSQYPMYLIVCLMAFCYQTDVIWAQPNRNHQNLLLLPTSRSAAQKLNQPCDELAYENSLRQVLHTFQQRYGFSIWLDRRVDPTQMVSLDLPAERLTYGEELRRIAVSCGLSAGLIENIVVIAPAELLPRMQRAAVVLHGQLAANKPGLAAKTSSLQWSEITSSNELLEIISLNWKLQLPVVSNNLPHDLFHAGQLPECSLATQLVLLLSGFDLQANLDARGPSEQSQVATVKILPLAMDKQWQDVYPASLTKSAMDQLRQRFPTGVIEPSGKDSLKVRGETELHLAVNFPPPTKRRTQQEKEKLLSLDIASPVPIEAVLGELSRRLDFEIVWSPECTARDRSRLITVSISDVPKTKLLEDVCSAAGLSCAFDGKQLIVSSK